MCEDTETYAVAQNLGENQTHIGRERLTSASLFEKTWDVAIKLCRGGQLDGQHFVVRLADEASDGTLRFRILNRQGQSVFSPPPDDESEAGGLFTAARRFVELEDAETRGIDPPDFVPLARRTYKDSLHEWGLMDAEGRVLKAYEYDPEPLLGYVVRVNDVYAYGIVKQTALAEGTITPTGACDGPDEARRRAIELLYLAMVRGATVMGMNGVPAVIDLSADPEDDDVP